jgi:5'-3' exoribonuclease 1
MGIPKFYGTWILRKRKHDLTTTVVPSNVMTLSLDLNSIFHNAAQVVYSYGEEENKERLDFINKYQSSHTKEEFDEYFENEHFNMIATMISQIVTYVRPQKKLILAVDGVAPLAKISQQRSRRYRSAMGSSTMKFDPNAITPGTDFMMRLDNFMLEYINSKQSFFPKEIIYSNHMVPGEGEQKIFDLIRDKVIDGYGAHLIYGLDADLIILSVICRLNGIYLIRMKPYKSEKTETKLKSHEELVCIDAVRKYIIKKIGLKSALDDFAVLTFFLGNDFLPTSPMFTGNLGETLDHLISMFSTFRRSLVWNGEVILENVYQFIKYLSYQENTRLIEVYKNKPKLGFQVLDKAVTYKNYYDKDNNLKEKLFIDSDIFADEWYTKAFGPSLENLDYFEMLPDNIIINLFETNPKRVSSLVMEYMTGISWTFIYYKHGILKANPNYVYTNYYAPLMKDVAKYYVGRRGPVKRDELKEEVDQDYTLPVLLQMLAVLPPQSKNLIPEELRKLMDDDSPIADMFPKKVFVDTDGKDLERLGIVKISFVQPKRLFGVGELIEMTEERFSLYEEQQSISVVNVVEKTFDPALDIEQININTQIVRDSDVEDVDLESFVEGKIGGNVEKENYSQ